VTLRHNPRKFLHFGRHIADVTPCYGVYSLNAQMSGLGTKRKSCAQSTTGFDPCGPSEPTGKVPPRNDRLLPYLAAA
jgi:hypothetical protein